MKFSIIIPLYNFENFIDDCLRSVLAQTFTDFEAICVDDGSTDKTSEMLDAYAALDHRLKAIHKKNGGEASSRNAGLDVAQGEWICFLDGDDLWAPSFLADVAEAINKQNNADMISVRQWNFNDGEQTVAPCHDNGMTVYETSTTLHRNLFAIGVWSTAYRRERFTNLRFILNCMGTDRHYTMQCLARSNCAVVLSARDYGYRIRGNSMQHSAWSVKKLADFSVSTRLCVEELAHSGKSIDPDVRRRFVALWLENAPAEILLVKNASDAKVLFGCWVNDLKRIDKETYHFMPVWFKIVSSVVKTLPYKTIVRMLCGLPFDLKRKGIHR